MYDVDDFRRQAHEELSGSDGHQRRFDELLRENEARIAELRARQEAAWQQLALLALPDPTLAALAALADRLRLPGLKALGEQTEARRRAIDARVAEIDATPAYVEREVRRVRVQAQLDEEQPLFDYTRQELQKMEALPGMRELVEEGWGTDRYPHRGILRFFNPDFLNDWRRADDIVAALEVEDFAEAEKRYRERAEQAAVMGESVGRLRGELEEIERLEQERAALLAEREALPAVLQQRAGRMLGQMLGARGRDGVHDFPDPQEALGVFATAEGVAHQADYLEEMNGRIRGDLSQLLDRSGRLREELRRYENDLHRYRNKRFTEEQFAKRFGRSHRFEGRHARYARASDTIYGFHDYHRGATWEDFLWWDLMTDGRMDGNFIPEVAEWRERHPADTYRPERDEAGLSDSSLFRDDS